MSFAGKLVIENPGDAELQARLLPKLVDTFFKSQSPNVRFYTRFIALFVLLVDIFDTQQGSRGGLLKTPWCCPNAHKYGTFTFFALWSRGAPGPGVSGGGGVYTWTNQWRRSVG